MRIDARAGHEQIADSQVAVCRYNTLTELASTGETNVAKIKPEILERLKRQARLQMETVASSKTAYEPLPHVKGKGFALLPPHDKAVGYRVYYHQGEGYGDTKFFNGASYGFEVAAPIK